MIAFRKAEENDEPSAWRIIKAVIGGGDTYVFPPDATEGEIPNAFVHKQNGPANALITYREL